MYKFLQRHFLTGLLSITPLVITTWILWRFYVLISSTMRPWLQRIPAVTETYPEFLLTLIGVIVFVLLITLVGLFTRNLIGIAFFRVLERFFEQIPVVKSVFSAIKQIAEVFLQDRRTAFQKVVLFAYPRQGLFSIGFVTRDEPENLLLRYSQQIQGLEARMGSRLRFGVQQAQQRIDELGMVMHHRMERKIGVDRQALVRLQSQLRMLNPLAVLGRGYSLTRTADGAVVRTSKDVGVGDRIITQLAEGKVVSNIEEIE